VIGSGSFSTTLGVTGLTTAQGGIAVGDLTSGYIPVAGAGGRLANLTAQVHEVDAKADYAAGDLDTEAEIITAINATNAKLNALLVKLENLKLLAIS
ncbi:MAG: hypothetical protein Q7T18_05955, partial [Sedimentisphaerales bacterium]|nr:hypothetical protein [Sedimentisphaerales bacterium]